MVDPIFVQLRKRFDFETGHRAFLDDFAGWPKPEQSRLIRAVAGDDGILPFLDVFAKDLLQGPTHAENARMTFLGHLCEKLTFDYPSSHIVGYLAGELRNLGEMGAGEFPEMLPIAVAVADLSSPLAKTSTEESGAALSRALGREHMAYGA